MSSRWWASASRCCALEGLLPLAELQVGVVLLGGEGQIVPHLGGLLAAALGRAGQLAGQAKVLQLLGLLLGGPVELQLGAGLDRLVVHLLERSARPVAAIDHLVDPVAALGGPAGELAVRLQLVEAAGVLLERLEVVPAGEVDHVGRGRVDEVADRVVRGVEHPLDVDQLEEDHQADGEHGVVGGADVVYVVVHLVGHQPELLEDQAVGDLLDALRAALGGVPGEGVQPLAGLGHEQRRAVDDPPRCRGRLGPSSAAG